MTPTKPPTLSGIRVPVEIANMAVQALQDRIATLEAAGQAKSAEIARLTALAAENERLRKHRDTLIERLDKAIEDIDRLAAKEGRDAK